MTPEALVRAAAEKWKIPNVICFSGARHGPDDSEGAEITTENLRFVAGRAADAGVTLALELLNSKIDHQDYQCDRTSWGVKVCQLVGLAARQAALRHLPHADHGGRHHPHHPGEPSSTSATTTPRAIQAATTLDDEQELNYRAIVHAILETGDEGFLGQEFVPKGQPGNSRSKAAFETCDVSA